jgi:hypothetical protein
VKNGVSNIESRVLVEGDDDSASEKWVGYSWQRKTKRRCRVWSLSYEMVARRPWQKK